MILGMVRYPESILVGSVVPEPTTMEWQNNGSLTKRPDSDVRASSEQ